MAGKFELSFSNRSPVRTPRHKRFHSTFEAAAAAGLAVLEALREKHAGDPERCGQMLPLIFGPGCDKHGTPAPGAGEGYFG